MPRLNDAIRTAQALVDGLAKEIEGKELREEHTLRAIEILERAGNGLEVMVGKADLLDIKLELAELRGELLKAQDRLREVKGEHNGGAA